MDRPFWMKLYKEWVEERAAERPEFVDELRLMAIEAIADDDVVWILKGIHALAVVGRPDDLTLIRGLERHANEWVARDAKTCVFELEQQARRSK